MPPLSVDDSALCVAVVHPARSDEDISLTVSLWDTFGSLKRFSIGGSKANSKVCWHLNRNGDSFVNDLLTPCLDEDGRHGEPEEPCVCGIDEPHLHAHVGDGSTCCSGDLDDAAVSRLAQLTLMHEGIQGLGDSMNLQPSRDCCDEINESSCVEKLAGNQQKRLYRIRHEDHVDTLMLDNDTNRLHLQHDNNACCGSLTYMGSRSLSNQVQIKFFSGAAAQSHGEISSRSVGQQQQEEKCAPKPKSTESCSSSKAGGHSHDHHHHHDHPSAETSELKSASAHPTVRKSDCCAGKWHVEVEKHKTSCCNHNESEVTKKYNSREPGIASTSCCSSDGTCSAEKASGTCAASAMPAPEPRSAGYCAGGTCSKEPLRAIDEDTSQSSCCRSKKCCDTQTEPTEIFAPLLHGNGQSVRSTFLCTQICCSSEVPMIRDVLEPLHGVDKIHVNVPLQQVLVDHNPEVLSAKQLEAILNENRFGATTLQDGSNEVKAESAMVTSILVGPGDSESQENIRDVLGTFDTQKLESFSVVDDIDNTNGCKIILNHNSLLLSVSSVTDAVSDALQIKLAVKVDGADTKKWDFDFAKEAKGNALNSNERLTTVHNARLRPTVALSGLFWFISGLAYIGGNLEYLEYAGLVSVFFGLPPIALKAFGSLKRCQFDTCCLMLFAVIGAIALQEFFEAAAVASLFGFSEWLEARATSRARQALSAIVKLQPESANLIHPTTQELIKVPASSVPVGALVSVRTGDKIPCDGFVVEGTSTVDESSLTGESRPIRKGPEDQVSGGTLNSGLTQLLVRTTSTAGDSAVSRLIRLVEEAQANRSDTEKLVDEFARIYTPIVVFCALLMCTIPWIWGHETGLRWTHNGLVWIVVACPCALVISTPVAYVAGLAATAQLGILIKGGAHLEALGLVSKICFDKTGTLTQGSFKLLHLNMMSGSPHSRQYVLERIALMEERASHPLARALVDAAKNEGVTVRKGLFVKDHTFVAGEGVSGTIGGEQIFVGNSRMFDRLGLLSGVSETEMLAVREWEATGGTIGFVSIGNAGIVCAYCVADAVRDEAADVVRTFQNMGVEVTMLTGDNHDAAQAIGSLVGLNSDGIRSQLLPSEKLTIVSNMKDGSAGKSKSILKNLLSKPQFVLMCGDGVNDAPALATADIGVAMGAGAALAMETADVTLLEDSSSTLKKLVTSVTMGKRVIRKIKENVVFSLLIKFLVLGFALAGQAPLWAAIASDVGTMLLVTINGMMLLPAKPSKQSLSTNTVESSFVKV